MRAAPGDRAGRAEGPARGPGGRSPPRVDSPRRPRGGKAAGLCCSRPLGVMRRLAAVLSPHREVLSLFLLVPGASQGPAGRRGPGLQQGSRAHLLPGSRAVLAGAAGRAPASLCCRLAFPAVLRVGSRCRARGRAALTGRGLVCPFWPRLVRGRAASAS